MYITNDEKVSVIAERAGVDRIFVDLEHIGKAERQRGMNTVQSKHSPEDIKKIKKVLSNAELLVRLNPPSSSKKEIDLAIENGADILMLPYFKSAEDAKKFIDTVDGRARVILLIETAEAVKNIDEILSLDGIDELFIGLNDLSLSTGKKFMFEPLADGTVDMLCNKFKAYKIPYGFGGIASLGKGLLPSDKIISEHYRLGSSSVILSRSFCNLSQISDYDEIEKLFSNGLRDIRAHEIFCQSIEDYEPNRLDVQNAVAKITELM